MISIDYVGSKTKDQKFGKIDSLPKVVGASRKSEIVFAHMLPTESHDAHAIKTVGREIRLSGYMVVIVKSDQESAILVLLEGGKNERRK